MDSHQDVVIIGGGIIGLACAHYLVKKNIKVTIIDQDKIGSGASHGNCGLLYFSGVIPLCAPGVVKHEIFRAICGKSPLYIKPRLDMGLFSWLVKFAAHCNTSHMNAAAQAKNEILRYSMALFDDLFLETPLDCDFEKKGLLTLFKDQQTFEAYEDTNAFLEKYDFGAVPLSRDETLNMEPAVGENIAGAWFNEHDWHLRPEMLVQAWKDLLVQKGVKIRENCRLLDFDTHQGKTRQVNTTQGPCTADAFVLATGAWAPRVSRQLDLNIPVQPGKGYSITMKRPEGSPRIPCTLYERNMVVTPWESGYRLGGTMEFSGFNDQLNKKRLNRLVQGAKEYLTVNTDLLVQEEWTGLRPMTYDDMPIIDRVSGRDNLFAATGHGMLGLTLATGTGKTVCDMICGEKPGIDPAPFSLNRF